MHSSFLPRNSIQGAQPDPFRNSISRGSLSDRAGSQTSPIRSRFHQRPCGLPGLAKLY